MTAGYEWHDGRLEAQSRRCFSGNDLGYPGSGHKNRGTRHASEKGHDHDEEGGSQRSEHGQDHDEEGGSQRSEDGRPHAQAGSPHREESHKYDKGSGEARHEEGEADDPHGRPEDGFGEHPPEHVEIARCLGVDQV